MEDSLHGIVVVRLEKGQSCGCQIILELTIKVDCGKGSLLQRIRLSDFELIHVNLLFLFVQDEHVTMVAGALWWECPEVRNDRLSTRDIVSFDVGTEKINNFLINQRSPRFTQNKIQSQ